jgi:hypothetical protein
MWLLAFRLLVAELLDLAMAKLFELAMASLCELDWN